jgi:peptidoglycan/LPS O-acetylase OafA/YrhL
MKFENKRLTAIVLAVALLLLIPFVAMRFSNEVKWSWFDFLIAGFLLLGTGLACEFVLRKVRRLEYRIAVVAVILFALFIVWAELAVGLIGTPLAGS